MAGIVGFQRHLGQVKLKVSDVTEELVLVDVPLNTTPEKSKRMHWGARQGKEVIPPGNVDVCVDKCYALERIASFDDGLFVRVANKLGIVEPTSCSATMVEGTTVRL